MQLSTLNSSLSTLKPEVLAPAGGWDCAKAAVENGADAIYFGVGRFNARARANNFELDDLPKLMRFLHRRGVRGYVTFNTLVFSDELGNALEDLKAIIAAGVDAAIVQDVGVARLIRQISPDFPIHASTQMTITSSAGTRFAQELGASLAVLSREVNVSELAVIRAAEPTGTAFPLEFFIHGALCVSYSGQCLTSESLGGRSANRGECAQACRLPYDLIVDGVPAKMGDKKYLLSPQDMSGIEALPELIRLKVRSLKIEGRLKSPEYVAAMTRVYRDCVDRLCEMVADGVDAESLKHFARDLRSRHAYVMEMAFSRGLYTGWLQGINNRELVHARFSKKRGVDLGRVVDVVPARACVFVEIKAPLKAGDGVVFEPRMGEAEREEGGYVYGVERAREGVAMVQFAKMNAMNWACIRVGDRLWKTADPALERDIHATWDKQVPQWTRPVAIHVIARAGEKLRASMHDFCGNAVTLESEQILPAATAKPVAAEYLREQFGRLGNTEFHLSDEWSAEIVGDPIVPASVANKLRRALVEALCRSRENSVNWHLNENFAFPQKTKTLNSQLPTLNSQLIPVVHTLEQLRGALDFGAKEIYGEFEQLRDYKTAVELAHGNGACFWAQPPRIFKQGEDGILAQVKNCGADGFLVRHHEHFYAFAGMPMRGDFSLNVANHLTAEYFLRERGLERITASYDMNLQQLAAMLENLSEPERVEVTLHQHMPMFHMEHCVFCSFLSQGKDFRDCGRPCEKHNVYLRDRTGLDHLLKADAGCRNTVFNARAQTGAEFFDEICSRGVRYFRIEVVEEDAAGTQKLLQFYSQLLAGTIDGNALWHEIKAVSRLGVTRGSLKNL